MKDGLAQAPGIGVFCMRDPGSHTPLDIVSGHRAVPPAVAQSAQPVAKPSHVLLGQPPAPAGQQYEAEKLGRLSGRHDLGLARMQPQPAPFKKSFNPRAPLLKPPPVVVE